MERNVNKNVRRIGVRNTKIFTIQSRSRVYANWLVTEKKATKGKIAVASVRSSICINEEGTV